jgi:hypothetical protein
MVWHGNLLQSLQSDLWQAYQSWKPSQTINLTVQLYRIRNATNHGDIEAQNRAEIIRSRISTGGCGSSYLGCSVKSFLSRGRSIRIRTDTSAIQPTLVAPL